MTTEAPTSQSGPKNLLALPAEIRLRIWKLCVPAESVIDVKFCMDPTGEASRPSSSVLSRMVQHTLQRNTIIRNVGLHLRLINRQIKAEAHPIMAAKSLRFCCRACFREFLKHLKTSHVGPYWLKAVEVGIDLTSQLLRRGYRVDLPVGSVNIDKTVLMALVEQEAREIRCVCLAYYGRLDLMGRESWDFVGNTRGGLYSGRYLESSSLVQADCFQYAVSGIFRL